MGGSAAKGAVVGAGHSRREERTTNALGRRLAAAASAMRHILIDHAKPSNGGLAGLQDPEKGQEGGGP
jgi:hypothetical protein